MGKRGTETRHTHALAVTCHRILNRYLAEWTWKRVGNLKPLSGRSHLDAGIKLPFFFFNDTREPSMLIIVKLFLMCLCSWGSSDSPRKCCGASDRPTNVIYSEIDRSLCLSTRGVHPSRMHVMTVGDRASAAFPAWAYWACRCWSRGLDSWAYWPKKGSGECMER